MKNKTFETRRNGGNGGRTLPRLNTDGTDQEGSRGVRIESLTASCDLSRASFLIMENDVQKRAMDLQRTTGVIVDEAQLSEFVHEKIDPRPRGADHVG